MGAMRKIDKIRVSGELFRLTASIDYSHQRLAKIGAHSELGRGKVIR